MRLCDCAIMRLCKSNIENEIMSLRVMKYYVGLIVTTVMLTFTSELSAQDTLGRKTQSLTLKTEYFQLKDKFNYGLVYNGLNLGVRYSLEKEFENAAFAYSPEISFGANFNKGIGLSWGFVPIDVFYGYKINSSETKPFTMGANLLFNYNWQLYPELQSGHMFWFTSIELGPQGILILPLKGRKIKITFSNSLVGFTSRPDFVTESSYYSLGISDFVTNGHKNLQFGSYNYFNHTDIEIELLNKRNKRFSLAYEFEYYGYYEVPKLSYLSHALNFKWKIGKL